jgi:hypothetical protein
MKSRCALNLMLLVVLLALTLSINAQTSHVLHTPDKTNGLGPGALTMDAAEPCPQSLLKNGVCTKAVETQSTPMPSQPQVTQVTGLSNRGGSNPDPKLLLQLGKFGGKGEYLPLVLASLSCNDPYMPASSFANQLNQRFNLLTQLQNSYGNAVETQQIFDFPSTPNNYLDGWNVFSADWYQVGWYCDALAISVSGQSQQNPIVDMKTANCAASHTATCTAPSFSTLLPSNALVLAIGVAVGIDGNPTNGFVSPGQGCAVVGGETSPLGTIVEMCGTQVNASANFGADGGVGMLTAIAIQ